MHEGHLHIARAAVERLALDALLLVPAAQPPHKRGWQLAPGAERLALLELACAGDPRLRPDPVELERDGVSYSYDTALALHARLPGAALHYVIGADTLADLPTWWRIRELAALVTFCPVTRPGWPLDVTPLADAIAPRDVARIREHVVAVEPHPASSTAIRAALAAGRRPDGLADAVYARILARGLYGTSTGGS